MTTLGVLFFAYLLMLALALAGFRAFSGRNGVSTHANRGAHGWSLALSLQIAGWILLALRWWLPMPWLEPPGCGLLLAGFSGMVHAMLAEVADVPLRWRGQWPALLLVALLAVALWLGWPTEQRLLLFWLCAVAAMLAGLPVLRAIARSDVAWPDRTMALLFVVALPVVLWRLGEQWLLPSPGPRMSAGLTPAQATVLVYFPSLPILASYGFVQMRHRRRSQHMRYLATHDGLTGLRNRDAFMEFGIRTMLGSRQGDDRLSALMIDVDHFKDINDRHGHAAGDAALRWVGTVLREAVREVDIAARLGGDEFALLLVGAQAGAAGEVAARIRARLAADAFAVDGGVVPLTLSIGIAETAGGRESLDGLLRRADRRLYAAKQSGRDRVAGEVQGESAPS